MTDLPADRPSGPRVGNIIMGAQVINTYHSHIAMGNFGTAVERELLVLEGVYQVAIAMTGGGGGNSSREDMIGVLAVMPGDIISLEVGGAGRRISLGGGWPDGGHPGRNTNYADSWGFGGGGSTRVYLNGSLVAVAGGAGGWTEASDPAFWLTRNPWGPTSGIATQGGRNGFPPVTWPGFSAGDGEDGRERRTGTPNTQFVGNGARWPAAGGASVFGGGAGGFLAGGNAPNIVSGRATASFTPCGPGGGGGGYYGGGSGGINTGNTTTQYPSGTVSGGGGGLSWYDPGVWTPTFWQVLNSSGFFNGAAGDFYQGHVYAWYYTPNTEKHTRWGGKLWPNDNTPEMVLTQMTAGIFGPDWPAL